jgi:tryprostatin B 6-hydroxylase
MGDFAFGKSFNMLKTSRKHFAIAWLESSTILLGLCSPISWAIPIGAISPLIGSNFRRFVRWCAEQVDERRDSEPKVPDVTSWLLKANGAMDRDDVEATKWLHGDSRLLIVAGSDTVAIVLTHLFYHLAADSTLVERLREELGPLMMRGDGEGFHVREVQHAKFLNAVINETMRMHPPVPSGVFRTTPKEGIVVDGIVIPGGVNVTVPFYVIGRCKSHTCMHECLGFDEFLVY